MTVKLKFSSAGSTLAIGSTISFSISNMKNYKSFAPSTNPFTFLSYSSSGSTYLRQQETSSIFIVTSQVASISSVSVSSDLDYLEEEAVYTFSFNVKSYIPSGGTVQITFPNIFTFNSPALNSCTYTCSALNQISTYEYSFTATNFPTSSSAITFSISMVVNPTYPVYSGLTGTEQFQFKTFDDNDFDMDYVQDGTFSLDCNLPCRSCSGSDPDSWCNWNQRDFICCQRQ
ncbi:hypothetical protein PPERSA_04585 [Pseudocohnilembus persalinus]|uniref:Uncharacterized protein n=1 Tax=Pseudocohnilembus persalinus TaxID=266149 RepID=A0A0V0QEE7_PSEPJ|nr:hypothetical protein PPERSA_04585 [Pseudocohnilembus persalinus]|eukprot:KRX00564.1 hypothetical protein PPERSA_04585 [Pseudocohnilembus persalinus]